MPSSSTLKSLLKRRGHECDGQWTVCGLFSPLGYSLQSSSNIKSSACMWREAASIPFPAYMQVTSAFPSSCSKPPSSRWDRVLGYPPPNTGKPPMPPAVGDRSSGETGLLTARLTERLDTSPCTVEAWRQGGKQAALITPQQTSNNASLARRSFSVFVHTTLRWFYYRHSQQLLTNREMTTLNTKWWLSLRFHV